MYEKVRLLVRGELGFVGILVACTFLLFCVCVCMCVCEPLESDGVLKFKDYLVCVLVSFYV